MEVTKKEAARILGISEKEVVRRIESGELKARKKTSSKFSDWIVIVPDKRKEQMSLAKAVDKKIKEKKAKPKPKPTKVEITETKEHLDLIIEEPVEELAVQAKPEPKSADIPVEGELEMEEPVEELVEEPREEVKDRIRRRRKEEADARAKKETKWWF